MACLQVLYSFDTYKNIVTKVTQIRCSLHTNSLLHYLPKNFRASHVILKIIYRNIYGCQIFIFPVHSKNY
jgi:hypothetical protein